MLLSSSLTVFNLSKVNWRSEELWEGDGITAKRDEFNTQLSELWELKVSRMDMRNLTSLSPDGIKACGAIHIEELIQKAMGTFRKVQNQAAIPRSFNIYDRRMGSALAKGAQEMNFFKSRKAFKYPHEKHAKP